MTEILRTTIQSPEQRAPYLSEVEIRPVKRLSLKDQGKVLVYDPSFDERDYQGFASFSQEEQTGLKAYTKRQFETYIGERVNVILSTTDCDIVNGKIVPDGVNEPMEDIIQRGIEYRKQHGNPIDFEREEAELIGFRKMQSRLTNPNTPIGAKSLSVSPRGEEGSDYKSDFFDEAVLTLNESGKRKIQIRRYLSSLDIDQYQDKLKPFKVFETTPNAADFLRDPIAIDVFEDPDDIQTYLNSGVKALEVEKLEKIKQIIAPFVASYISSLINNPEDLWFHRLKYNAVLNQADIALQALRTNDQKLLKDLYLTSAFASGDAIEKKMRFLGMQPVREAGGPCPGKSGGFDLGGQLGFTSSPFSVSEFGNIKSSDKQTLCCTCPFCKEQVEAVIGGGKIKCPNCKKEAAWK